MQKTAIVIGGSGLIGNLLVQALLQDEAYSSVKALVRKPLAIQHPKLTNLVLRFDDENALNIALTGDVVFCCVGTTIKKAGSQAAFRAVDKEIPLKCAAIAHKNGVPQFLLVSAVGAKASSSNFYLRTKGETEAGLREIGFSSLYFLRPSFLIGSRSEVRIGEQIAAMLAPVMRFLLPKKYSPVKAATVVRTMISLDKSPKPGVHIIEGFED
ncbi:NAD(P)H-binding protein [Chitinophaga sp. SYP-B3965]|uniref:NAD(P)H-binding protein n=1 Tax=Chitinophaga sp. SYP-B3965 TaxID=2663120 RepID=UPI0012995398|nr:NAD(P)H-binding protein [Chitinophaga sp. SYP-B3965]MRG47148.1 NAD(P)H-binding protein [Chitinophaga sp. SYP-B3965]